jgi:adenylosuccinate synthase
LIKKGDTVATKKAYVITDLGFGDGGKGGVVHKICTYAKPHTVIKVGGAQGSHGVSYSDGRKFNFSQFGCGTFEGIQTHISDKFVVSPVGLLNEAEVLESYGVWNPLARLTVDERVLIATPFHGISSRLKEMARKKNKRGIIGVGVGEASLDAEMNPSLAIYAQDIKKSELREKLRAILEAKRQEIALLYENEFLTEDAGEVKDQLAMLRDENFFTWVCEVFEDFARKVHIVDGGYLTREIFSRDGSLVFESSHGVLTDRYYGFHPHTTRLRTVPHHNAEAVLAEGGWSDQIVRLGVMRSYQIKHGPGPFVVDTPQMARTLLPFEFGNPDRYSGQVRIGPLDLVALRYARDVCGGAEMFDGLCVTWCDTVSRLGKFSVCSSYDGANVPLFFTEEGHLRVSHRSSDEQLLHQERLTQLLLTCSPHVKHYELTSSSTNDDARRVVADVLHEALGIPVRMAGFGPSVMDKQLF